MKRQLLKDLADLEAANVITADTAANIKSYYAGQEGAHPNRLGIILGILGTLLAGSGILLIIAHNWDELNKLTKTVFAFLPLLIGQLICAYALIRRRDDPAWREGSAVFLFLSVPACIALISQIYQVGGELSSFLFTWLLLTLPLIYIMNSSITMLLGIAVATWYAANVGYYDRPTTAPYLYMLMLLFMGPHYYRQWKHRPDSNMVLLMNLFLAISFIITLGSFVQHTDNLYPFTYALYLLLFCAYYFFAIEPESKKDGLVKRPFYLSGLAGILIILFTWSFNWPWDSARVPKMGNMLLQPLFYLLVGGLFVNGWLIKKKQARLENYLPGYSFMLFLVSLIFLYSFPQLGLLLINGFILSIAIVYIRLGSRENHFGILNFGLIILGILALCRFFDDSIPFVWRGVFFLLTGIAFFASNYYLIRKRKKLTTT